MPERNSLADWAKALRSTELEKAGRQLVFETAAVETGKRRSQVQVLVCSDVIVLSQLRKKSTFSRKKPELTWVRAPRVEKDISELKVALISDGVDHELFCNNRQIYDDLLEALGRCSDVAEEKESHRSVAIETEEEAALMDGVKIAQVFERMTMWAGAGEGTAAKDISKAEVQCIKVFQEIIDTERTYVQDLRKLVSEYIQPLQQATLKDDRLIASEDLLHIFNNVESILKVNSELLKALQNGVMQISRNGEIPSLCEVAGVFAKEFVRVVPFFKMYSVYCHQYNAALERLIALRENNKELANFLQRREARKKNQQASVQSLLIKPVQRICKYPLLFRELLNNMNKIGLERKDDSDFLQHVQELSNAEKEVQGIANMVNTKVSEAENQDQVMKVFLDLGGETGCPGLVTPSRRFVRMEDVLMREAPFAENRRQRFRLFLFNDLIIFAKIQNGTLGKMGGTLGRTLTSKTKLKVTHRFDLDQCKGVKKTTTIDEEGRHGFEIRRVFRGERNTPKPSAPSSTNGPTLSSSSSSSASTSASSTSASSAPTSASSSSASSSGAGRATTQIQRFEVWCDTKNVCESLMGDMEKTLQVLEGNIGARESVGHSRGGKQRVWASRTRPRQWRASYSGSSRGLEDELAGGESTGGDSTTGESSQSFSGGSTTQTSIQTTSSFSSVVSVSTSPNSASGSRHTGEGENDLPPSPPLQNQSAALSRKQSFEKPTAQQRSLDDLKTRYMPAPLLKPDPENGGTLRIDIEFPAGPLGLALENSRSPKGVLVACVAALSVAERGGLALGDRVVAVGGNDIPEDATWDQVVDIIKSLSRPLTISFERTAETMAAGMSKHAQTKGKRSKRGNMGGTQSSSGATSGASSPSGSPTSAMSKDSAIPRGGQRQWAAKLDKRKASLGTTRLLSLHELEACYSASASAVTTSQDKAETVLEKIEQVVKTQATGLTQEQLTKKVPQAISVLREILATERSYVCDLRKLVGEYMLPLRQARTSANQLVLDPEDEQAIFLNVEGILKVNTEFLNGLTKRLSELESPGLGQVILSFTKELQVILPFFKVYSTFCHRYSSALSTLVDCRKSNQSLDNFMKQREERPENKHASLQSLLIKPVQRICKYPLLFRALQESVDGFLLLGAEVHEELISTVRAVERSASEVNQKVSEAENMDTVMRVYNMFGGESGCPGLVEPHRRFVAQFDVSALKAPFYEGKALPRTLFVFNDMVLFGECKKRNSGSQESRAMSQYKLTDQIDLRKCDVKSLASSSSKSLATIHSSPGDNKNDNCFQLTQVTRTLVKNTTNNNTTQGGGNVVSASSPASSSPKLNSSSSKVTTCIEKIRVTCSSREECQQIVEVISKEIDNLIEVDTSKRVATAGGPSYNSGSLGGSLKRRDSLKKTVGVSGGVRAWNKRNGTGAVGGGTPGRMSLEDMENKYSRG